MHGFERRIEKIYSIAVDFNQKPNAMIEITSGKVKTYGSPLSFKLTPRDGCKDGVKAASRCTKASECDQNISNQTFTPSILKTMG
jgi:hypothetical protein